MHNTLAPWGTVGIHVSRFFSPTTVVPGFSVLGFRRFRALPGFRALCTENQIWIYVINLPGFSALPGFKAPFHGDGQSALNPGTTVYLPKYKNIALLFFFHLLMLCKPGLSQAA